MKRLSVGVYSGLVRATDVFGSTTQSAIQYQGEQHKKTTALMCLYFASNLSRFVHACMQLLFTLTYILYNLYKG